MNKKLASTGSLLSKNLKNIESLTIDKLTCTSSINTEAISCVTLDIPTNLPSKTFAGTMYFDINSKELFIYDGDDWNYVALINIPTVP